MRNFGNMHANPGHYGALYAMNPGHYGNVEAVMGGVGATGLGVLGAIAGALVAPMVFPRSKNAALYGAAALGLGSFVYFAPKKDDLS
ncbi:hypothetical protein K0U83_01095 [bacterium]|nr:hypothetical protein [bacterium]